MYRFSRSGLLSKYVIFSSVVHLLGMSISIAAAFIVFRILSGFIPKLCAIFSIRASLCRFCIDGVSFALFRPMVFGALTISWPILSATPFADFVAVPAISPSSAGLPRDWPSLPRLVFDFARLRVERPRLVRFATS